MISIGQRDRNEYLFHEIFKPCNPASSSQMPSLPAWLQGLQWLAWKPPCAVKVRRRLACGGAKAGQVQGSTTLVLDCYLKRGMRLFSQLGTAD